MKKSILIAIVSTSALIAPFQAFSRTVQGQLVTPTSSILRFKNIKFGPQLGLNLKNVLSTTNSHGNFKVELSAGKWVLVVHGYKPLVVTIPPDNSTGAFDLAQITLNPLP